MVFDISIKSQVRLAILFLTLYLTSTANSQSLIDRTKINTERESIKSSDIKSKSIWEYHYDPGNENALSDSGYKSYYYKYDDDGKVVEFTKFHIFSDLTIREVYQYKYINMVYAARYNAAGEMIETIEYKYNKQGRLRQEIHTAYFNSIKPGIYFTILASIHDDTLFSLLQNDLEIEPKFESYTITINITDPDEQNQYIVIGDESDPTSPRYSWSQLSMESQRGLLSWKGPNRKEHQYISKNLSNVDYKYDKNGNLISKEVYNTSNDLLEKDFYMYNPNNKMIAFYKYNENGKLSSTEIYQYDNKGNLIENDGLNPDGKVASRLVYKYDNLNNLTEKIWYNTNSEVNSRYKNTYDLNGRLIDEAKFRGETEKESHLVYKYDDNGILEEITKYDINDKKEKLIKYVYEYY